MSKSNFHILAAVLAPLYRHGQPAAAAAETAATPVPSPSVWTEQQLGFHPRPERVQTQRRTAAVNTIPEAA